MALLTGVSAGRNLLQKVVYHRIEGILARDDKEIDGLQTGSLGWKGLEAYIIRRKGHVGEEVVHVILEHGGKRAQTSPQTYKNYELHGARLNKLPDTYVAGEHRILLAPDVSPL
jgi:hypothetical protein